MGKGIRICAMLAMAGLLEARAQMAKKYDWKFPEGNLVSNWSFERDADETCMPSTSSLGVSDCKFKMSMAPSGDYVMKVVPGAVSSGQSHSTDFLRLEPNAYYNFSVWVKGNWDPTNTGQTAPVLEFFTESKAAIGSPVTLEPYEVTQDPQDPAWGLYVAPFLAPQNAAFLKVRLLKVLSLQKAANSFYFDNLLIQPASGKLGVVESRSFEDAAGAVEQNVTSNGKGDVVSFTTYDPERRPVREYVPIAIKTPLQLINPSLIAVGTQVPGENLDYDFATIDDAYQALRDWAATRSISTIGTVIINVVVDAGNPVAPAGTPTGQRFEAMTASGGEKVAFTIKGIFRGTAEYQTLLAAHGPPARRVPSSTKYSHVSLYPSAYEAQYPGEDNFYSETKYPAPGDDTFEESSMPGAGYDLPAGHTDKNGWALVTSSTNTAGTPEVSGPAAPAGADGLLYQWSRSRQGDYSMSLSTPEGLVTNAGQLLGGEWNDAAFYYDSFNRRYAMSSPAFDYTTTDYDGQNRIVRTSSADRGSTEYLYDDKGRLRFVHPAESGSPTFMIAHKYDAVGRPIESGKTAYTWDEVQVENSQTFPSAALETGRLYDAFTAADWLAKTSVSLSTLGINVNQLRNGKGKLVAAYNRNPEATGSVFTSSPDRRLVASLYSYDSLGRVDTVFKWNGAPSVAADCIQKIIYTYDNGGRLSSKQVALTGWSSQIANAQRFEYDALGRVQTVLDKDYRPMVSYAYGELGYLEEARLYGKFRIRWTYSIRGELRKIEATTIGANPEYIFSEELGYDGKTNPDDDVPDPMQPQYDGKISSILRKFSKEISSPVKLIQYEYDALGRLTQAQHVTAGAQVGGTPILEGDGKIDFSNVSFTAGSSISSEGYNYDNDGSIISKSSPTMGWNEYTYHPGTFVPSHRVKDVSGTRANGAPMTASGGNFRYDARGRLIEDVGSQKTFTYGFYNDRVYRVNVPNRSFHMLYDENMNRVAELEYNAGSALIGSKITVYESGLRVAREYVYRSSSHPLGAVSLVKNSLLSAGGLVGFENQATGQKKLLLKDHIGSTVKVLDEATGGYVGQEEYDYWAYGILDRKVVASGDMKPAGTYTGKEYEEALGLYYFGARFYDPELGLWLIPDPAGQYPNPYSYGNGAVISGADPNGEWFFIVLGIIIGGYIGGSLAQEWTSNNSPEWNPLDWKWKEPETYGGIIVGGAIGAVGGWAAEGYFPGAAAAADKFFAGFEPVLSLNGHQIPLTHGWGPAFGAVATGLASDMVIMGGHSLVNAANDKLHGGRTECPDQPAKNFMANYEQKLREAKADNPGKEIEVSYTEYLGSDGIMKSYPVNVAVCEPGKDCEVLTLFPSKGDFRTEHNHPEGWEQVPSRGKDTKNAANYPRGDWYLYGEYTQTHYRYTGRDVIAQECDGVKF